MIGTMIEHFWNILYYTLLADLTYIELRGIMESSHETNDCMSVQLEAILLNGLLLFGLICILYTQFNFRNVFWENVFFFEKYAILKNTLN